MRRVLILFLLLVAGLSAAPTIVRQRLYAPDGRVAVGGKLELEVTQPFTAADGTYVPAQIKTYTISPSGWVSVSVVPNIGSTPSSWYNVRLTITGSPTAKSIWQVPVSADPVTIPEVTVSDSVSPDFMVLLSQLSLSSGSLIRGSSAGVGEAVSPGANGYFLQMVGGYPAWAAAPSGAVWGTITGTLANQTDLQAALNAKLDTSGTAALATDLAANPADCGLNQYARQIAANGDLTCATVGVSVLSGGGAGVTTWLATPTSANFYAALVNKTGSDNVVFSTSPTLIAPDLGEPTALVATNATGIAAGLTAGAATALAATVPTGRLWVANGTGAPTSDSVICADTTNHWLGIGTCAPDRMFHVHLPVGQSVAAKFSLSGSGAFGQIINNGSVKYEAVTGSATFGTTGGNETVFEVNSTERARFDASTGNFLIGTTSNLGYGLHAGKTGTNGTMLCYDPTATTGTTKCVERGGAGQSGNIWEVQNSAGSALASVSSAGNMTAGAYFTNGVITTPEIRPFSGSNLLFSNATATDAPLIRFGGATTSFPALRRSAAILQSRLADDSAFAQFQASRIVTNQDTPSASSDACTAGAIWADATYVYACTATAAIKRIPLIIF